MHPARGLAHPVCTHAGEPSALASTRHGAGCKVIQVQGRGMSAGNDMNGHAVSVAPGTASLAPVMVHRRVRQA